MNNGLLYVRAELRQKYFETPGYKKFSDLYKTDHYKYQDLRDNWLFLKMLGIENENIDSEHLKLVIEKHKDTINWPNFYAYFDERLRMEKDKPVGITSRDDVEYVLARLEPYRSELCVVYNAY
jgi:hypothetical protein